MTVTKLPLKQTASEQQSRMDRAAQLADRFSDAGALTILDAILTREFPGQIALVSSFGAESAVLLHLAAQVDPAVPVIFLETGKHFAQTLSYRRKLANLLGLSNIIDVIPAASDLAEKDSAGELWRADADACCNLRKVRPLATALAGFDAWITGRKQFHGGARVRLPVFDAHERHIKVNPLARWTVEEISAYRKKNTLPQHPLVEQGFPSIGCWPCTHPVANADDGRAGRWRGRAKTECGIHL